MSLDRWISLQIDHAPDPQRVLAIQDHEDVDVVIRRDLAGGETLLMLRVRPVGDFEGLLFGLAFVDDACASCGPGAAHQDDPAARAWEALSRSHALSLALAHALDDLTEDGEPPGDASHALRADIRRVCSLADWTARAVLECYRGLLSEVVTTWTSGSAARNLVTRRLAAGSRRTSAQGLRAISRLVSMWALSVLSMGGAEEGHPLLLGPDARESMLISVKHVERQLDGLVERLG